MQNIRKYDNGELKKWKKRNEEKHERREIFRKIQHSFMGYVQNFTGTGRHRKEEAIRNDRK